MPVNGKLSAKVSEKGAVSVYMELDGSRSRSTTNELENAARARD